MFECLRGFVFTIAGAAALLVSAGNFAEAASFRQGVSAFNRQDYLLASQNFFPLAEQVTEFLQAAETRISFSDTLQKFIQRQIGVAHEDVADHADNVPAAAR